MWSVSLLASLLINLSSQGQIDDMLFAGDNIYLNSFCLKKKELSIYLFIFGFPLGLPGCVDLSLWELLLLQRRALECSGFSVAVACGRLSEDLVVVADSLSCPVDVKSSPTRD